ncbi:sensor histidine kinase [Paenibacillus sedimenti]|uniref:Sensor histidine kinase n=1 Tax=Paenibacillus sedimenti TaxID=2770274 RepID=A0A926KXP5_9BACL|nr:sensor histidine kinase [Paenibacillus sedimenti]MBD0384771.1 sensor histidine kinase [Paenibacillus sedimenti]
MLRNPFKTYRINAVFFFSSAALIALLIGIVISISYNGTSKQIEQNTSYYQQRLLNELSKKLNTSLIGVEQTSNTAAKNFDLLYGKLFESDAYERARLNSEIRDQLNYIVFGTTILQSIHVFSEHSFTSDSQGPVIFLPMSQLSRESWYNDIRDTDSAWLKEHTIHAKSREESVISFARKVVNNSNQYYSLLVFNIKVSDFKHLISSEDGTANIALLDAADKLITHSGNGNLLLSAAGKLVGEMEQPSGSRRVGNDFYVWAKSPDSQWTLIEATSWREMMSGSREMARLFILLGATTILLVFLITLLLSKRFMKPMNQLLKTMNQYSIGEEQQLPTDYTNEFGRLFQGYRKLTFRIEELYSSLRVQHQRQRDAELKSLQMMINPHFLYNTLDQINWTAIEAKQDKISQMLSEVAGMFRLALSNANSLVSVKEEVAHIECYLKFQKVRWEDRLSYKLNVEEDVLQEAIPKIMLQPFIENAFMHGFHGVRYAELHVNINRDADYLNIVIADNGKGLSKEWQSKPSKRGGYGLRNVKERLDALFGDRYVVEVKNREGSGVEALIRFPIERQLVNREEIINDVENSDRR